MNRKSKRFPTAEEAQADMRRCANCQQPFSLALDGGDCPNCGCTDSAALYPVVEQEPIRQVIA